MSNQPAPKPHDPRAPHTTVDGLREQFNAAVSEPADSLAAEVEQLSRAHALLRDALQEG